MGVRGVGRGEMRGDPYSGGGRVLSPREIDGGRIGEAVAHFGSDVDVAGDHLVDRSKRNVPLQPQKLSARAVRVVEQPIAAADYRMRHGLVSEAEARREILEV